MKTILLMAIAIVLFTGCGDESFNTVKYYKDHPKERDRLIEACNNTLKMTTVQKQNCQNAYTALRVPAQDIDLTRHYGEGW